MKCHRATVAPHVYPDWPRASGRLRHAGPFSDKSGDAGLVRVENLGRVQAIACTWPVHAGGSSRAAVYEWNV